MTYKEYQEILLPSLPHQPGVYRFLDADGTILYVGKAKNLRNRVANYFTGGKNLPYKTRVLVRTANNLEFTIVETEADALLLENTLIKRFQPRYNVMLKDDKSYSYICIRNERFPRVYITRRVIRDGSQYFGPYTSKARLKVILELIKQLFPLRTCSFNLSEENIEKGKFKVCLEYHIKNCAGPCEGMEDEESYNEKIEQIKNTLKGNFASVKRHFQELMIKHSEDLQYEKAQQIKDKLSAFEDYQGKSTVVNQNIKDVDVFSIAGDEKSAYVNYLKVVNGAIINTYTQELVKNLDSEPEDLLSFTIPQLREKFNSIAGEILVPMEIEFPTDEFKVTVPKIGDKKKLLELSEKNVKYHLLQKQKEKASQTRKQTSSERILRTLQSDLNMDVLPMHLECFDNSNFQGSYPVSSCVVFKNAKPSKKDYRHYNVKTVEGPNDFATMEEVVRRRYTRLVKENEPLPQLVIIDGGKGQLGAAAKILQEIGILEKVTLIGIAKRLEEIFFPGDPVPIYINKKSESLKLIQQARNEAHRFAITFHRDQRSRGLTKTSLTDIKGVGAKTAEKLLKHFGSVKKIQAASQEELASLAGKSAAAKVRAFFESATTTTENPDQEQNTTS
ncbi:MAG: excinuclease ABC subunit C [Saprospiraceae bacterium]|nr:excinuclease ABC subunit C [Saprospiraceae bacterium]